MYRKSFFLPKLLSLALFALLAGCVTFAPEPEDAAAPAPMAESGDQISLLVVDADTRVILEDQNADRPIIPASTLKIATGVMALGVLGPEYRFETSVVTTGTLRNGVLQGDVFLIGGGDPLLDAGDLMGLVQGLRQSGIHKVQGRFFYDDSALAGFTAIDANQPLDAVYNTGLSALSVHFNRAKLIWRRGWEEPSLSPQAAQSQWAIGTKVSPPVRMTLPLRDPALVTAQLFQDFARQTGLELADPQRGSAGEGSMVRALHLSAPLGEILQEGLEYSNNMVSELIGLSTVTAAQGDASTLRSSAETMRDWFRGNLTKVDWSQSFFANHSGLSSATQTTARQMLGVLNFGGPFLWSRLPLSGFDDSQSIHWSHPLLAGKFWAKSGTMRYARGVVGRLQTEGGRSLLIALYIQAPEARKAYDQLKQSALNPSPADKAGDVWNAQARAKEAEILLDLAKRY